MNPNLHCSQVVRSPGSGIGKQTGELDMTIIAKMVNSLQNMKILKPLEQKQETKDVFLARANKQMEWFEVNQLALDEKASPNDHGSFYHNQLIPLLAFARNFEHAKMHLEEFYNGICLG
ncbi:uncharacterized protein L203_106283 [Cryptococcus depauperatus CBS 7841]|uniref:Alginate lyase domain-containing protein n=1 Tax=Cryptococcus depauperatus CBS 7841 TaxID=1295531 RepID=A0AAJ8M4Y6_9TREE